MRMTEHEIEQLNQKLLYCGAWLTRYSPGDGVTRYRLVDAKEWASHHDGTLMDIGDGNIPKPDYFSGFAIQTALGSREARLMVDAYIAGFDIGWSVGYGAKK